jgi:hypothetical protein
VKILIDGTPTEVDTMAGEQLRYLIAGGIAEMLKRFRNLDVEILHDGNRFDSRLAVTQPATGTRIVVTVEPFAL